MQYYVHRGLTIVGDDEPSNSFYITTRKESDTHPLRVGKLTIKYLLTTSELLEWDVAWDKYKPQHPNIDYVMFYPSLDACYRAIDKFFEEKPEYFV